MWPILDHSATQLPQFPLVVVLGITLRIALVCVVRGRPKHPSQRRQAAGSGIAPIIPRYSTYRIRHSLRTPLFISYSIRYPIRYSLFVGLITRQQNDNDSPIYQILFSSFSFTPRISISHTFSPFSLVAEQVRKLLRPAPSRSIR